ncbi:Pentatricopeptide repeat-containing protein [Zea mays]|uniref:Pentatricopeptide repeat-containing protein n=1 Tax=Zea mays TaxID=4577 RepID=A0A1D6J734_MAIZE|nr:Pentatricopeptide repeat-containing protein [Zea mays]
MFDAMPRRDGGSWNAIISASSRAGHPAEAFSLFADMNSLGIRPKDFTLASVLACCAAECLDLRGAQAAQQLHGHIVYGKCLSLTDARRAFDDILQPNDVFMEHNHPEVSSCCTKALQPGPKEGCGDVHFGCVRVELAVCGRIADAKLVFDGMEQHNLVSWNAMLTGYVKPMDLAGALDLFQQMRQRRRRSLM